MVGYKVRQQFMRIAGSSPHYSALNFSYILSFLSIDFIVVLKFKKGILSETYYKITVLNFLIYLNT